MHRVMIVIGGILILAFGTVFAQGNSCPADYAGFLPPRLQIGGRGVVMPGGTGNRVRSEPNANGERIGTILPDTEFDVLDGPKCDSDAGIIWWQVKADDGLTGWTAEGLLPDQYFIEPAAPKATPSPYPTLRPSPTPTAVALPGLNLPPLAVLSADNIGKAEIIGQFPITRRVLSVFMSPDMVYFFVVYRDAITYANAYTFPALQSITQGIMLDQEGGAGEGLRNSQAVFTPDSRMLAAAHSDRVAVYQLGDVQSSYEDIHQGAGIYAYDLGSQGIVAMEYGKVSADGNSVSPELCFIDFEGGQYAPDHKLCIPRPSRTNGLAFLADGRRVIDANPDSIDLLDAYTGEVLQTFDFNGVKFGPMAVLPGTDDAHLPTVLLGKNGYVLSANLEIGEKHNYLIGEGIVPYRIIPSPNGQQMIVIESVVSELDALVIDIASRKTIFRTSISFRSRVEYNVDGSLALIDGTVYETAGFQPVRKHGRGEIAFGFSPDGTMLFVADQYTNTDDTAMLEIYGVPAS